MHLGVDIGRKRESLEFHSQELGYLDLRSPVGRRASQVHAGVGHEHEATMSNDDGRLGKLI